MAGLMKKTKQYLMTHGIAGIFIKVSSYILFCLKKRLYRAQGIYAQIDNLNDVKIIAASGTIGIFWKGIELVSDMGRGIRFFVLGNCYEPLFSEWSVKSFDNSKLVIKSRWQELPLTQVLEFNLAGERKINLSVRIEFEEDLKIEDKRFIFLASEKYSQLEVPFKDACLIRSKEYVPDILFVLKEENVILPATLDNDERVDRKNKLLEIGFSEESARKEYTAGIYDYFSADIFLFDKDKEGQRLLFSKCKEIKNSLVDSNGNFLASQSQEQSDGVFSVVLVNLPWQKDGFCGVRAGSRWPHIKDKAEGDYLPFPFYLAYAASLLKDNGFRVKLIDAIAEGLTEEIFLSKLSELKPDLLLVETSTVSLNHDIELLKKVKKLKTRLALCGPDVNIRNPLFLKENKFVDYVLTGEYEFNLLALVKCLRDGGDLSCLKGLLYRKGQDDIIFTGIGTLIKNLDEMPWPLREQLPLMKYLDAPCEMPFPTAQMWASRGCPFSCIFCLWPQIMYGGNQYRVRSVIDVVDEMEYLVKEMGFKSIYFDDDTFNVGKKRMLEFCQELKKRELRVPWAIMARADLMDEEILLCMKDAGLYAVKYGLESAVPELLESANKKMDLERSKHMIRFTKQLGIKTHLTFTFGLPGETKETIARTTDCAFELDPDSAQFSITTYYPGTEYFDYLDKKGLIITKDWSSYDGNSKSIMKSDFLSVEDLENAKFKAVERWLEHKRLKRPLNENYLVFKRFLNKEGLLVTIKKSAAYFKRRYAVNGVIRILGKFNKQGDFLVKLMKYISTGKVASDYLDILGVFDGAYAYKGPNFVQIDVTNDCNNDCIGCWCNSPLLGDKQQSPETKSKTIPYPKVKDLVDDLKRSGTKEIYLAGGGEPFMHPHIMEIIAYIKQNNLICDVNTNFTLVDEEKIKTLVDVKLDSIVVSVWAATAKTYVAVHPNKNEETFYNIKKRLLSLNLIKQKAPYVRIYNVISNLNFHEIEAMVDFALEVKADSVVFTVLDTIPDRTDVLLLNEEQKKEVLAQIKSIRQRKDLKNLELCEFEKFERRVLCSGSENAEYDRENLESMPCYIGWLFSRIMADGNVNACLKAHRIPVGNIYKNSFSEIWNGMLQQEFRKRTLAFRKDDAYFSMIGNDPNSKFGCYKSCDDMNRNCYMHKRIALVSAFEKSIFKFIANSKKNLRFLNSRKINFTLSRKSFISNVDSRVSCDIALIVTPPWIVKMPPLGIAYLVTYLKHKGFNPFLYDLNVKLHNSSNKAKQNLWEISSLNSKSPERAAFDIFSAFKNKLSVFVDELLLLDTKVIGFSTNLISLWVALEIAKLIKERAREKIIIFGGPGCFWDYKRIPPGVVDAFVIGEGEAALCEILDALKQGSQIKDIPGVIVNQEGKYSNLINRKPLDINTIPYPTFKEFRLSEYNRESGYKPLPLLTSRGCLGRCSYCIDHRMWGPVRTRTAASVFSEVEYFINNYQKKEFEFNDLICNGNLKELEKFSELLIKAGHKINWVSYAIIRKDMQKDLFVKMRKGGCHTLIYGMESGSNTVLKRMNKYYTAEEAERVLRFTHEAGICTNINIIVGFPGETEDELNETVEFLRRNKNYIDEVTNVSGCVLFAESEMGHNRDKFGIKLREGADTLLFEDNSGINPEVRKFRVERMLKDISDMGIRRAIINNPTEKRIKFSKNLETEAVSKK